MSACVPSSTSIGLNAESATDPKRTWIEFASSYARIPNIEAIQYITADGNFGCCWIWSLLQPVQKSQSHHLGLSTYDGRAREMIVCLRIDFSPHRSPQLLFRSPYSCLTGERLHSPYRPCPCTVGAPSPRHFQRRRSPCECRSVFETPADPPHVFCY